ncbi:MAG: heme exporter protein CcmB [Myxococcota bacterium]
MTSFFQWIGQLARQTAAMVYKEMLTEWRMRVRVSGIFWFSVAIVMMVAFSIQSSTMLKEIAGGTLWIAILLASTRSLDQSYQVEHEQGAMEGLLLWPVDPIAVYYGKAIANMLVLLGVALAVLPLLLAIYDRPMLGSWPQLIGTIVLGCAAIAAPGTLLGLITSQARGSSVMLPLLLFPLVVPALLAASMSTSRLMEGDPMNVAPPWMLVLVVVNCVFWSFPSVLYGLIFED